VARAHPAAPPRLGLDRRSAGSPADVPREGFVGDPDAGIFQHPVIVDGVTLDDVLYQEETFGPIAPVATFETFDEALDARQRPRLRAVLAIYTTRPEHAFRFREGVTAGMVSVNNSTSGAEAHLPFGGNGKSGNGARQSGVWMLDQVTRWQSMNWDYSGKLQKAQMDVAEISSSRGHSRWCSEPRSISTTGRRSR
jgi:alpha-ketoglutaric semialdehyde dehydrogenase